MKSKAWTEKFMQGVFAVAACASVLAVALICIFLFANGIPAMSKIGFGEFLTGELWKPKNDIYGIFPMIIGSLYVTAGAIIIGVPIGILTAVFMAFYCPKVIYKPLKMATELLAGIPSVVYGFFGLVVLVPWVREIGRTLHRGGNGSITISDPGVLVYAFNLSFHVTSLLLIILPPLQKRYTEVQKKDKYEENYAGCDQCFSVKSGCISHLNYDIGCQCSDSSEDSFRHSRLITSHHDHCHRLSDRTSDSQDNSCHYSGFGCR